ncbi:MAG TPA: flavodoxin-dependent (E)-4-hydroxy-3-methylbut-2-enyl-diphosphate synthase, partial [Tenuifilaceae bacterium]|nr:flavodoxin-dependent (E)-4-hydroxy-3-methylbut-2-enyl-diphosphate synthase [Tenuifilaceae bacterium]
GVMVTAPAIADEDICSTVFSVLQAARTRITKTDYIACPGCGRTLFNLQQTLEKVKAHTGHLRGLKIAVMGCIVNGPGEMADADYGYVGAGPGRVTLYKGKQVMKKNIPEEDALDELIGLINADRGL